MSPELQNKLYSDFPELFRARCTSVEHALQKWGIECGDGWFDLIHNCASEIEVLAKQHGHSADATSWPEIVQVKEKFGTLRIHLNHHLPEYKDALEKYRSLSSHTCEACGDAGEPMQGKHGILTCCSQHQEPAELNAHPTIPLWLRLKASEIDE